MDFDLNSIKREPDARSVDIQPANPFLPNSELGLIPLPSLPFIPDDHRSANSRDYVSDNSTHESDDEASKPSKPKVPRTALESLFEDDILVTGEEVLTPVEIARKEVQSYMGHKPASMKENPLEWWKEREIYFPSLSRLASKYLCTQATSVASERVFSTTGDIVSATRACLSPEHVNALVFLKKNMEF